MANFQLTTLDNSFFDELESTPNALEALKFCISTYSQQKHNSCETHDSLESMRSKLLKILLLEGKYQDIQEILEHLPEKYTRLLYKKLIQSAPVDIEDKQQIAFSKQYIDLLFRPDFESLLNSSFDPNVMHSCNNVDIAETLCFIGAIEGYEPQVIEHVKNSINQLANEISSTHDFFETTTLHDLTCILHLALGSNYDFQSEADNALAQIAKIINDPRRLKDALANSQDWMDVILSSHLLFPLLVDQMGQANSFDMLCKLKENLEDIFEEKIDNEYFKKLTGKARLLQDHQKFLLLCDIEDPKNDPLEDILPLTKLPDQELEKLIEIAELYYDVFGTHEDISPVFKKHRLLFTNNINARLSDKIDSTPWDSIISMAQLEPEVEIAALIGYEKKLLFWALQSNETSILNESLQRMAEYSSYLIEQYYSRTTSKAVDAIEIGLDEYISIINPLLEIGYIDEAKELLFSLMEFARSLSLKSSFAINLQEKILCLIPATDSKEEAISFLKDIFKTANNHLLNKNQANNYKIKMLNAYCSGLVFAETEEFED